MFNGQFIFFSPADAVLFHRNDAERAEWTHQEFALVCSFPYDPDKVITRGMRIGFEDSRGTFQLFEIRNVVNTEPDHMQDITAEHIIISELTDIHLMEYAPDSVVNAQTAVGAVLTGTTWSIGTCTSAATHKPDLSLTNVWAALTEIRDMYGLRLEPYVTINSTSITGRYIDIVDNVGVWRGVRLSINKNINQVGVTYNDTNLVTAVYGYGKQLDDEYTPPTRPTSGDSGSGDSSGHGDQSNASRAHGSGSSASSSEYGAPYVTIKPAVWAQTADHPAKPSGQMYLEDPEATALYGRNGTPRFGFYSNSDVDDADELLSLCWEALKRQNKPQITIDCTISTLEDYGLNGEHIQIGDTVRVEVEPLGVVHELMCICLTEDLLDPEQTRPTIGKYIKDLVYITKEQENAASGGGGGGGGGANEDKIEQEKSVYTVFDRTDEYILMQAVNIQKVEGALNTAYSEIYMTASEISAEVTRATGAEATLSSRITVNADAITAEVTRAGNAESALQLTLDGITMTSSGVITIKGQSVNLGDYVTIANLQANYATITSLNATDALISDLRSGNASFTLLDANDVSCDGITTDSITVNGEDPMKGIKSFGTATESGGQISIPTTCLDYTSGPSINFNIAATQYYQNGVAAAEAAARAEFTLASVTLQGESESVYIPDNTGTIYYTAGMAVYKRGTQIERKTTGYLYDSNGEPVGYGAWFVDSVMSTQYLYRTGDQVTPINSSNYIRIKSGTAYKAGQTVSDTYYTHQAS